MAALAQMRSHRPGMEEQQGYVCVCMCVHTCADAFWGRPEPRRGVQDRQARGRCWTAGGQLAKQGCRASPAHPHTEPCEGAYATHACHSITFHTGQTGNLPPTPALLSHTCTSKMQLSESSGLWLFVHLFLFWFLSTSFAFLLGKTRASTSSSCP